MLRTLIGTEGYLAPELKGFFTADDESRDDPNHQSYTFAVDMWSLGEILFRLLTYQAAFRNSRDLFNYVVHSRPLPVETLLLNNASEESIDFLTRVMSASPQRRLTAREAALHKWIQDSRPESRPSSRGSEPSVITAVAPSCVHF